MLHQRVPVTTVLLPLARWRVVPADCAQSRGAASQRIECVDLQSVREQKCDHLTLVLGWTDAAMLMQDLIAVCRVRPTHSLQHSCSV